MNNAQEYEPRNADFPVICVDFSMAPTQRKSFLAPTSGSGLPQYPSHIGSSGSDKRRRFLSCVTERYMVSSHDCTPIHTFEFVSKARDLIS